MSELDRIRDDVEKYYAETETKHYNLVKDLRDQPLFTFDTLLKFAAMYKYEKANGVSTSDSGLHLQRVNNLAKLAGFVRQQKDLPPEINEIVNKEFWNLI